MIELLKDLPLSAVGFRASGEVSKEDYERIVIPAVDELAKRTGSINFLLLLDTDVKNYTAGGALSDFWVGVKHFTQWRKIAIVSDQEGVNKFTEVISGAIPGESKAFTKDQLEIAKTWLIS